MSRIEPSHLGYFQSLAEELGSQSSRVRQLIGDRHWGHDGRHKEVLLQNLVRRHCPSTVLVSTGFIVSPNDPEVLSKEQDLLVIDVSAEAPLFHQGDLVVSFPHTVVAAISIKSTLDGSSIKDVVEGLATVRETARNANCKAGRIWCAGFFFNLKAELESDPETIYEHLSKSILASPVPKPIIDDGLPHMMGPDLIVEATRYAFQIHYTTNGRQHSAKALGYDCNGVATAVFLAGLIEHINIFYGRNNSAFTDCFSTLNLQQLDPKEYRIAH